MVQTGVVGGTSILVLTDLRDLSNIIAGSYIVCSELCLLMVSCAVFGFHQIYFRLTGLHPVRQACLASGPGNKNSECEIILIISFAGADDRQ